MKGQKRHFWAKPDSMITSVLEMIKQWFWHHRVCLVKVHRTMYIMAMKGQGQNCTSGQGHVVTEVFHMTRCVLMRETRNHSHVYISSESKGIRKLTPGSSFITEDLSQYHSEWMEMFRCGKEIVEILPIDLAWGGHEIDQGPYSYLFAYARNLRTPKLCVRKNGILSSGLLTYDNFQTCVRKKSFSCVRKQIFGILTCLAYAKSHATML